MSQVTSASRTFVLLACLIGLGTSELGAQPRPRPERVRHEFLLLDIDVAATKKFATVQNHLRVGQLVEAVELLRSINDGQSGKLVAAAPGRYVNWRTYANMLAAALSPEGLKIYREQFDPLFRPTFEAGRDALDETLLLKVVEQGYCCTFADDALLMLGDLAWDDGDIWKAKSFWEQLLPPVQPAEPGDPVLLLAYPDSNVDRGLVLGRLALCAIQAGRLDAARWIAGRLTAAEPAAVGHLAGRTGPLREIIQDSIDNAQKQPPPVRSSLFQTFGGHPRRFDRVQQRTEIGTLRWNVPLRQYGGMQRRGFLPGSGGACYFPVVYGDMLLVQDGDDIYAYRLDTGEPVWPAEDGGAKIFSVEDLDPGLNRGSGDRPLANIGLPRFTMTVSDGRLYARMGSVNPLGGDRGGVLVCLDLAHRDGKLVWNAFAGAIETGDADWNFEGSPLVIGNHVYVGLRRSNPQPQSNVACFDAATGKLLWNRKLCVGSANPNIPDFDVNQHLLTWGDGTLYYATHMGAIAALEPNSGTLKWLVTYPRVEDPKFRHELEFRLRRGPLPAMFADGTLYVAPLDSDDLLAIEAETGVVKWTQSFHSPVQSLLGVSNGLLYVSGSQLWAVSANSGRVVWPQAGDREPEAAGFGRGLLVGDSIYWPNHEEILIVDQTTGAVRQRFPLTAAHGQSGGNLLLVDGYLVVAEPDRLAVFADLPELKRQLQPGEKPSRNSPPARRAWDLGRIDAAERNWNAAADQFHRVMELAQPNDEWQGLPLRRVAHEREFDMRLRVARKSLDTNGPPQETIKLLQQAIDVAPDQVRRGMGLGLAVQWLKDSSDIGPVPFAQQVLSDPSLEKLRFRSPREGPCFLPDLMSKVLKTPAAASRDSNSSAAVQQQSTAEKPTSDANPGDAVQILSTSLDNLPWPLTRRWSRSLGASCRFWKPVGKPPNPAAACLLADQSPVLCLNPTDGSVRWQLRLSRPLTWAAYYQETLLLGTSHDVRAVSLANGEALWWSALKNGTLKTSPMSDAPVTHAAFFMAANSEFPASQPVTAKVWNHPLLCSPEGTFSEFLLADNLLLIRQGRRRVVAWQAATGEPVWNFDSDHGVAPGIVCAEQQVLLGTIAPGAIVTLDLDSGAQIGQWQTESAPWIERPVVRENQSILTVTKRGQIVSWCKPGPAWYTEEGPLAWRWAGTLTQSHQPPQLLVHGDVSLLIIDGDTLAVADSLNGELLWKVGLGREIVLRASETICFDDQRVYIPADGILRAYALRSGKLEWECAVGLPNQAWKAQLIGDSVIVHPAQAKAGISCALTVCEAASGQFRQRLALNSHSADQHAVDINLFAVGSELLLACGGTLVGLGSR